VHDDDDDAVGNNNNKQNNNYSMVSNLSFTTMKCFGWMSLLADELLQTTTTSEQQHILSNHPYLSLLYRLSFSFVHDNNNNNNHGSL